MPCQAEDVEAQVMQGTTAERKHLLARLINNLGIAHDVEAARKHVADQSEADLEASLVQEIPFEETMTQLRDTLASVVNIAGS